jgi:hypothetical protein
VATAIACAAETNRIGDFGTDAFARINRDIVLNNVRQSVCLPEQVYWFLILTSQCGPHVREACYLRDRRGYVVKDQTGKEVPLRQKDICEALDVENRSLVHKALHKLVQQKRLVIDAGMLYPVLNPKKLAELLAEEEKSYDADTPSWRTYCLGVRVPDDLKRGSPETRAETIAGLERIRAECAAETNRIQKRYRSGLQQYFSDRRIIIDEEIEEIEEITHTQEEPSGSGEPSPVCVPDEVSSDPPEAPPTPAVPPNALIKPFAPAESWACFWSVYSKFSDSKQEEAKRWWFRHVRSDEYAAEVMEGLLRWRASDRWSRGIVQHAVNFLKNHEYRESPAPKKAASKREEVKDRLMEWADARDRAKEQRNGGGT